MDATHVCFTVGWRERSWEEEFCCRVKEEEDLEV